MSASFLDALVYYRTKFPDLASLGTGNPPATWKAELDVVAPEALDAMTATTVNLDGGSVSGSLNFAQVWKMRALHARRAELDETYINPYLQPVPQIMTARRAGTIVRLGL